MTSELSTVSSFARWGLLRVCVLAGSLLLAGCTWLEGLPVTLPGIVTATPAPTALPSPTQVPAESTGTAVPPTPNGTGTPVQGPQTLALQLWVPDFLSPDVDSEVSQVLAAQIGSFVDVTHDVQVQVVVKNDSGTGGLYNLISTAYAVAPSILPDVVVMNQHDLIGAAELGLIQPLSSSLPPDAGFFPTAMDAVTAEGEVWAFPYVGKAEHMAYAAEITQTLPLSWTSVLSGSYQMLFPAGPVDGLAGDSLLAIYLGSGGRVVDQNGQPALDRASLERVYGFFGALRDAGLLDAETALALPDAAACWDLYQSGVGQMTPVPAGLFWKSYAEPAGEDEFAVAWALPGAVPTASGSETVILKTWGLAVVTQDSTRREAALGLVRWLVSAQHMANLTRAAELVPTRRAAVEAWPIDSQSVATFADLLTDSVPPLLPSVDSTVRRALQVGLAALLQQEADSAEAAASLALTALRR